ncbi:MAG: hypothetical protein ACYTHK_15330 [Planctomycetota bacterium]|jgi:hypothetical protein
MPFTRLTLNNSGPEPADGTARVDHPTGPTDANVGTVAPGTTGSTPASITGETEITAGHTRITTPTKTWVLRSSIVGSPINDATMEVHADGSASITATVGGGPVTMPMT